MGYKLYTYLGCVQHSTLKSTDRFDLRTLRMNILCRSLYAVMLYCYCITRNGEPETVMRDTSVMLSQTHITDSEALAPPRQYNGQ